MIATFLQHLIFYLILRSFVLTFKTIALGTSILKNNYSSYHMGVITLIRTTCNVIIALFFTFWIKFNLNLLKMIF